MILRIVFVLCSLSLSVSDATESHKLEKRQTNYQYVNFELPNNTNHFQLPSDSSAQYGHFQNQFQNFNPRPVAEQFNPNSIRRFPQFPNASPANDEPLISVLSGSNQYHPSQSVSWNPPPTITPPQVTNARGRSVDSVQTYPFKTEPELQIAPKASANLQIEDKPRVNLQAGNSNQLDKPTSSVSSTTAAPVAASGTSGKDPKKDDVVIYYYYYYDDEKNKTDGGLDPIPSLEGYDGTTKPKPGKVIIKNDNYVPPPKETGPQIIPFKVDSRINGGQAIPSSLSNSQSSLNSLPEVPIVVPTTERPSTTAAPVASAPTIDNQGHISNIFRYGSSPTTNAPLIVNNNNNNDIRPAIVSTQSESFESNKLGESQPLPPKVSTSDNINNLPNFSSDKVIIPDEVLADLNTAPIHIQSTTSTTTTTTSTTTTTTTPAPTTTSTTTTTTTTTPAPVEEVTEAPKRRFGHRRPGLSSIRTNPLNRIRSTTSTTTTPSPSTTERRTFTRPSPITPQSRRPNRFRKRPGYGGTENNVDSDANSDGSTLPNVSQTSTTAAPVVRVETSSFSPRGRFGGRNRFGSNRQQTTSSVTQSSTSTTTQSSFTTEAPVSSTRRSFSSRGRPQLRGGGARAPFGRNRNVKPTTTEEVTPDPNETSSTAANESSSSSSVSIAASPDTNESVTEPSANGENQSDSSAPAESSSTEKPARGRGRPLFGSRPRPNLFGRRGNNSNQ
ncbi:hypothetical protein RDWZM_001919 [Blomia tropicalis]|uniref:Mucin-5AC n=1 Tax=Blomia tropicalis TaxID=40697 RepID=A0A9Q0RR13_BLOTA|nr:hypothetical protein RDWZM_001919 [Blomia tropicalis]